MLIIQMLLIISYYGIDLDKHVYLLESIDKVYHIAYSSNKKVTNRKEGDKFLAKITMDCTQILNKEYVCNANNMEVLND